MTKDNLIELYLIFKKNQAIYELLQENNDVSARIIDKIQNLTDNDIELIKTSKYPIRAFRLLSDYSFSLYYDDETKKQILEIINNTNEENIDATLMAATTHRINAINLIDLVANAKGKEQAENACKIIINDDDKLQNMPSENLEEIVKIITTNKSGKIAYYIQRFIQELSQIDPESNSNEIDSKTTIDIIKKIASAKGEEQAASGVDIALNYDIRKNITATGKDIKEIIKYVSLVTTEKNIEKANSITNVLTDEDAIKKGLSYGIAKIIKSAKEEAAATYAAEAAIDINLLELLTKEEVLKLVNTISQAKKEYQAYYAHRVAIDYDVLKSGHVLELVDIISNAKDEYNAKYSYRLARNEALLQTNELLDFVKQASMVAKGERISLTPDQIEAIIAKSNTAEDESYREYYHNHNYSDLYSIFDVKDNFWKLFKLNPDEAIQLLNETIKDPQEDINANTKVRVKRR